MAGYTDNREQNQEIKYLRKVLGQVDQGIPVPDGVRGAALRQRLDNIQPDVPAAPDKRSGISFGLHWFSLHSGLTYAAAFAVIVGLFYGLGFHQQPQIEKGTIQVEDASGLESVEVPFSSSESAEESPAPMTIQGQEVELPSQPPPAEDIQESQASQPPAESAPETVMGVGGGGISQKLGEHAGYTYNWRQNDTTDPDKAGIPVTVEVVSNADMQIVAMLDIPDITAVEQAFFTDTALVLVGAGEAGVVTRSYGVENPAEPRELLVMNQPGVYVESRMYKDTVHTATYLEDAAQAGELETEVLPGAVRESACVISALELETGGTAQVVFLGASDDINLFNVYAYITYDGVPASGEETGEAPEESGVEQIDVGEASEEDSAGDEAGEPEVTSQLAQIKLEGTTVALENVA